MIDEAMRERIVAECTDRGGDHLGEVAEAWLLMPYVGRETLRQRIRRLADRTGRRELDVRRDIKQVRAIARAEVLVAFSESQRVG